MAELAEIGEQLDELVVRVRDRKCLSHDLLPDTSNERTATRPERQPFQHFALRWRIARKPDRLYTRGEKHLTRKIHSEIAHDGTMIAHATLCDRIRILICSL
jgi:hypothetical protein